MPIFEYQCESCGDRYEIFHKGKEVTQDILCPLCASPHHKRLLSVPSIGSGIKSKNETAMRRCAYANSSQCSGDCDLYK